MLLSHKTWPWTSLTAHTTLFVGNLISVDPVTSNSSILRFVSQLRLSLWATQPIIHNYLLMAISKVSPQTQNKLVMLLFKLDPPLVFLVSGSWHWLSLSYTPLSNPLTESSKFPSYILQKCPFLIIFLDTVLVLECLRIISDLFYQMYSCFLLISPYYCWKGFSVNTLIWSCHSMASSTFADNAWHTRPCVVCTLPTSLSSLTSYHSPTTSVL